MNITGIFDSSGFPCFSSSLIQDRRESLDEVPVIRNTVNSMAILQGVCWEAFKETGIPHMLLNCDRV